MTLLTVVLSLFVDPHPDPGQEGKRRPCEKEGSSEVGSVADALGHPAGERTHKRAGQTSQRAEQRILGGSLGLVAHAHEKGEERRGAEAAAERLDEGRTIHEQLRGWERRRSRIGQV